MAHDRVGGGVGLGSRERAHRVDEPAAGRQEVGRPTTPISTCVRASLLRSSLLDCATTARDDAGPSPRPEHGASTRMRSNGPRRAGRGRVLGEHEQRAHRAGAPLGDRDPPGRRCRSAPDHGRRSARPAHAAQHGLAAGRGAGIEDALARAAGRAPGRRRPRPDPVRRTTLRRSPGSRAGSPPSSRKQVGSSDADRGSWPATRATPAGAARAWSHGVRPQHRAAPCVASARRPARPHRSEADGPARCTAHADMPVRTRRRRRRLASGPAGRFS